VCARVSETAWKQASFQQLRRTSTEFRSSRNELLTYVPYRNSGRARPVGIRIAPYLRCVSRSDVPASEPELEDLEVLLDLFRLAYDIDRRVATPDVDVSVPQVVVMSIVALYHLWRSASASEIARKIGFPAGTVSNALKRFIDAPGPALVEVVPGAKRSDTKYKLTRQGKAQARRYANAGIDSFRRLARERSTHPTLRTVKGADI
jgi:DNA-binding MarR family transcriptional regulator